MNTPSTDNLEVVSTRAFAAPRERVFEAFYDPHQLVFWWGPKGFTNTFEEFDLRPGGQWRFTMHAPTGAEYHNLSEFVEIARPERIVFRELVRGCDVYHSEFAARERSRLVEHDCIDPSGVLEPAAIADEQPVTGTERGGDRHDQRDGEAERMWTRDDENRDDAFDSESGRCVEQQPYDQGQQPGTDGNECEPEGRAVGERLRA